jgi:ABC-type amino acid transport substrate-binding protein
VRTYETYDDAFNALVAGQLDAVIVDLPAGQDAVKRKQGLEGDRIDTDEQYGFAVREDADALREAVNEALVEIKQDGTYARIYREWFEKDPPEEILEATHSPS